MKTYFLEYKYIFLNTKYFSLHIKFFYYSLDADALLRYFSFKGLICLASAQHFFLLDGSGTTTTYSTSNTNFSLCLKIYLKINRNIFYFKITYINAKKYK